MVNMPKFFKDDEADPDKLLLPLLPLRDIVIFPHMVAPLFVGREKSVNALSDAMNKDKEVFLATQRKAGVDNPGESDISHVGTIGKVLQLLRLPDGTVKALVEGNTRARIDRFIHNDDFFQVELTKITSPDLPQAEAEALNRSVLEGFEEYAKLNKNISKELLNNVASITDPSQMADTVAAHFSFKIEDKQRLLEAIDLSERMSLLLSLIKMEIEVFQMDQRIKSRVKEQMEKTQKNYYLNEQMRAIKKEMGSEDEAADEIKELEAKIKNKKMSKEGTEKTAQELKKLKMMTPMSAEATVVRNYIDWILSLPWYETTEVQDELDEAEKRYSMRIITGLRNQKNGYWNIWRFRPWSKRSAARFCALSGLPGSGRPHWPNPLPEPPAANMSAFHWAEFGMKLKSGATAGPTLEPCRVKLFNPLKKPGSITLYFAWMKSIR